MISFIYLQVREAGCATKTKSFIWGWQW